MCNSTPVLAAQRKVYDQVQVEQRQSPTAISTPLLLGNTLFGPSQPGTPADEKMQSPLFPIVVQKSSSSEFSNSIGNAKTPPQIATDSVLQHIARTSPQIAQAQGGMESYSAIYSSTTGANGAPIVQGVNGAHGTSIVTPPPLFQSGNVVAGPVGVQAVSPLPYAQTSSVNASYASHGPSRQIAL